MATITVHITQGGSALQDATVIFGDVVPGGMVTNESGTITKTVDAGYSIFVPLTILHNDILDGRRDYGTQLLEADGEYTFTV